MKPIALLVLLAAAGTASAARRRELLQDDGVGIAIANGTDAPRGRFRYAVSLRPDIPGDFGDHFCTAALIAPRLVLTAAHCVWSEFYNEPYPTRILPNARIGGYFRSRRNPLDYELRKVVATVVHPRFGASNLYLNRPRLRNYLNNDVAVLLLDRPSSMPTLRLAPYIPKTRLPVPPGGSVTSLGWGLLDEGLNTQASALQMLDMSALSLPACRVLDGSNFGGGPVTFSWDTNSAWCATAAPRNAGFCFGDSGGPLITRGKSAGEDVHVGLASWSRKPCGNTFPYAFTDTAAMRNWIDAAARELTTSLTATVMGNLAAAGFDRSKFRARPVGATLDIFNSTTAEFFFPLNLWALRGTVVNGGMRRVVFNVYRDYAIAARLLVVADGGKLTVTLTQGGRTTTLAPGANVRVPRGAVQYGRQSWGKARLVVVTQQGLRVAITQPFNPRLRQRKDGVPGGFAAYLNAAVTLTKSAAPVQKLGGLLAATQPSVSTRP